MKLFPYICGFILLTAPALAQDAGDVAFVKTVLKQAQIKSLKSKREYCGYIGITSNGRLQATPPTRGRLDSCYANDPPEYLELIASYHTHAAFDMDADSEVPSSDDMRADMAEDVDGYVATPGGRIWFIDGQRGIAKQICGRNCITADASFRPAVFGPVKRQYSLRQLKARERDY